MTIQETTFNPNDNWITDDDIPDPQTLPTIVGHSILVRPLKIKKKTKGGIIMPETYRNDVEYLSNVGRVLSKPDEATIKVIADVDLYLAHLLDRVNVGDFVVWKKNAGTRMMYQGIKLTVLRDPQQVLFVIKDPEYIDQNYNIASY